MIPLNAHPLLVPHCATLPAGVNNQFLVASNDPLAELYNDQSPMVGHPTALYDSHALIGQ